MPASLTCAADFGKSKQLKKKMAAWPADFTSHVIVRKKSTARRLPATLSCAGIS